LQHVATKEIVDDLAELSDSERTAEIDDRSQRGRHVHVEPTDDVSIFE